MAKCIWFCFLQETLVFRPKTNNSQITPKLAINNLQNSLHTSVVSGKGVTIMMYTMMEIAWILYRLPAFSQKIDETITFQGIR